MSTSGMRELRSVMPLFFAGHRSRAWLGAGVAALTVLAGMALLGLSGWFITATAIAGLNVVMAISFDVFMPSAGIRLLAVGRTGLRYAERLMTHDATLAVLATLRVKLFRGWAAPGAARRLLTRPAQLLFRLTTDIDALDSVYLRVMVPMFAATMAALATGMALALIDVWLGMVMGLWLLVSGLGIASVVARRARHIARRRHHALEALRARSVDLVAGQSELLMHGRLSAQHNKLIRSDTYMGEADDALNHLESLSGMAYAMTSSAMLCGTLLWVAFLVEEGSINTPVAALVLLLVLTAMEPFSALRRGALEWGRTLLAARRLGMRIKETGEEEADVTVKQGFALHLDEVVGDPAGVLEQGMPYLNGISLQVKTGERVALIGRSGAGKSTLMSILAGELAPQAGKMGVCPHALLTQRTELFQDSVRDNLLLAAPQANDERLWQVLRQAGLADVVALMPHGLDTRLGEGGFGLSGGQARRLALARVFLRDVPLWLLDEPTEGLDHATARDVMDCLLRVLQEDRRAVLVATHVRHEAVLADRIVCMDKGVIVADARRGEPLFDTLLDSLRVH